MQERPTARGRAVREVPIEESKAIRKLLEGATSGCTLPPHDGVRHHVVEQPSTGDGFVVTFVPKSMFAPHQCIVGKYKDRYYIRAGSNFELASHGLLSGMFGRQPTPNIFAMWGCGGKISPDSYAPSINSLPTSTPYVWCQIVIRNHGVTVARDIYVNLQIRFPGPNCLGRISKVEKGWSFHESIGGWHVISDSTYRLAPASMVTPIGYSLYLKPPFVAQLSYEISFGCANSPVHRIVAEIVPEKVEAAYRAFIAGGQDKQAGFVFAREVLHLDRDQEYYDVEF